MSKALEKIKTYRLDTLKDLLDQCTVKQQRFFFRIYPMGIDNIPEEKLDWAIRQCEANVVRNNKYA